MKFARPLRLALALGTALSLCMPAYAEDADPGAYLAARHADIHADYSNAATYYAKALMADPTNPALMEGAVIANIATGNFAVATAVSRRMAQAQTNSQVAYLALLVDQLNRRAWDEALADMDAGRSVGALVDGLVRAWVELGRGQMSEALAGFDAVAEAPGLEAFGLYHKSLALALAGDFEGADDILSGRVAGTLGMGRRGVIAHVQVLSQLERNADAIALLTEQFGPSADPEIDALRARLVAGEVLPFDAARGAADGLAEVFFTFATAMNGEAADGFTLIYARIAASLRPDHTETVLLIASVLEAQGQYDLATEAYNQIPEGNPAFHAAAIGRAEALYSAGKVEAAIKSLEQLGKSHGDLLSVHLALGDMLRREERFEDAVKAYDRAIERIEGSDARNWRLYYSRAVCHERLKNWDLAEPDFRKALELNPDQPQVLNYLGYSFVEMNENLDEALDMIERAVAARPNDGYITDSLAWVYYRLGRYEDAVEPMERASLLEPVDPIVTDHLGDIYWAVGRKLEARFQWRRALSYEPEEKDAVRIRRKLEVGLDVVLSEEGAPPLGAKADGN